MAALQRPPLEEGNSDVQGGLLEAPTALIVREHAQIAVEGKNAAAFYVIVAGRACAEIGENDGELGPGDSFGAEALNHSAVYNSSVTAETDLRLIAFPGEELRRLCRKFPLLDERVRTSLAATGGAPKRHPSKRSSGDLESENRRLRAALSELLADQERTSTA